MRKNQDAILCSSCDTWSQAKCLKLTVTGFKYYLQHPDLEWTCAFCSLPKLSDSVFDETGSFTLNESNCEDEEREVESVDTGVRQTQTADCRLADPRLADRRLADRRPADLQTCRLDKLAHSEICRPTFFLTSTNHVSSFLRAFQKPGHPSISRQNG